MARAVLSYRGAVPPAGRFREDDLAFQLDGPGAHVWTQAQWQPLGQPLGQPRPGRPRPAVDPVTEAPEPELEQVLAWPEVLAVIRPGALRGVEPLEGRAAPAEATDGEGRRVLRYDGGAALAGGPALRQALGQAGRTLTVVQLARATGGTYGARFQAMSRERLIVALRHKSHGAVDLSFRAGDGVASREIAFEPNRPELGVWRLSTADLQAWDSASALFLDDTLDVLRDDAMDARTRNPRAARSIAARNLPAGLGRPAMPCDSVTFGWGAAWSNLPAAGWQGEELITVAFRGLSPLRRIQAQRAVARAFGMEALAPARPRVVRPELLRPAFREEFRGPLDVSPRGQGTRWRATINRTNLQRTLAGNREGQFYGNAETGHPDTLRVRDGVLEIRARKGIPNPLGLPYVSGAICAAQFSQLYGYVEYERQVPAGPGLWGGCWLLPADGTWPPEDDVEENLGHSPGLVHQTLHTGRENRAIPRLSLLPPGPDGFNRVGRLWTPDSILFVTDGLVRHEIPTPPDFHKPFYPIFNLAVGGSMPGRITDATPEEAVLRIRAVRAWSMEAA